jgi:hypothetical protein
MFLVENGVLHNVEEKRHNFFYFIRFTNKLEINTCRLGMISYMKKS